MRQESFPEAAASEVRRLREQIAELERRIDELNGEAGRQASPLCFRNDEASIRRLLKARRIREQQLGADLFADPAWDILLEALAAQLGEKRVRVRELSEAVAVPATTSVRWINKLEDAGFLVHRCDPVDAKQDWIELTSEGSMKLQRYLQDVSLTLLLG